MIPLTTLDGTPVDLEKASIGEVLPLGAGAIVFLKIGTPVWVAEPVNRIMAFWKRPSK